MNFRCLEYLIESFKINSVRDSLILVLISYISWCILRGIIKWWFNQKKLPLGPIGIPLLESLPFFGSEPHKTLFGWRQKYGDIIGLYLGRRYTVFLNEYSVIKEVFSNPLSLDRATQTFDYIPRFGFTSANREPWVEQRKFSMSTIKDLGVGKMYWEEVVKIEVQSFVDYLREAEGKPIEVSDSLQVSSNIIFILNGSKPRQDADIIEITLKLNQIIFELATVVGVVSIIPGLHKLLKLAKIGNYGKFAGINEKFSNVIKAINDIKINGVTIPKGADIIPNLWAIHHDPNYWEHPDKFIPERFLTKNSTELRKNPSSFYPFSTGRRGYPGERIAWMELISYFSEIIRNFEVATSDGVKPDFRTTTGIIKNLVLQELCFIVRKELVKLAL